MNRCCLQHICARGMCCLYWRVAGGRIIASLLCLLASGVGSLAAQEQVPSWFTPSAVISEQWSLIYTPAAPLRFELVQKNAPNDSPPYEIMLVFPKRSSAYDTAIERITEQFLARSLAVRFTAVNFEGDPEQGAALIDEIRRQDYDLVFSIGSTSTKFVASNAQTLDVPIVSVTSKDPVLLGHVADYTSGSGTNIAYTSLDIPINVQLAYLRDLRPNLAHIAVIYARDNISAYQTQVVPLIDAVADSVTVIEVVVEEQGNAAAELAAKIPQAVERMRGADPRFENSIFWVTGSTSVFTEIETIVANSGRVPVFSLVTDVVSRGANSAVLSIGIGFSSNADLAAFYAIDILENGVDPGALPVGIVNPPDIAINFLVAKRIEFKIPFNFLELAATVYGPNGVLRRKDGVLVPN